MITCPECHGKKKILGVFPVWAEDVPQEKRLPFVVLPCYFCEGKGEVSDEVPEWIKQGKKLASSRRSHWLTLFSAARLLDIPADTLSKMERGQIKPDMSISYPTNSK